MYNTNQRQYMNWVEFLKDIAMFSEDFDYEKSFGMKNYSYFKKDGQQVFAGNFAAFVESLKSDLGLGINPKGCFDSGFATTILFDDYMADLTKAKEKQEKIAYTDSLMKMQKPELLDLAKSKDESAKSSMNKEKLIELILASD